MPCSAPARKKPPARRAHPPRPHPARPGSPLNNPRSNSASPHYPRATNPGRRAHAGRHRIPNAQPRPAANDRGRTYTCYACTCCTGSGADPCASRRCSGCPGFRHAASACRAAKPGGDSCCRTCRDAEIPAAFGQHGARHPQRHRPRPAAPWRAQTPPHANCPRQHRRTARAGQCQLLSGLLGRPAAGQPQRPVDRTKPTTPVIQIRPTPSLHQRPCPTKRPQRTQRT